MAFHDKTKMHWGDNMDIDNAQTRQGNIYKDPKFALHDPLAHGERPGNLIRFIDCVDVRVQDVTFQNSPTWKIVFINIDTQEAMSQAPERSNRLSTPTSRWSVTTKRLRREATITTIGIRGRLLKGIERVWAAGRN